MSRSIVSLFLVLLTIVILSSCNEEENSFITFREKGIRSEIYDMTYESGNWDHPDYTQPFTSNGNHRILITISDSEQPIVQVKIPWRRRDDNPENKAIIIIDSTTNQPVKNQFIVEVNGESGHLLFQPNSGSNQYYVYYLPHRSTGGYYPTLVYLPVKQQASPWFSDKDFTMEQLERIPWASIKCAQSIDDFNSFFPMEIIATQKEVADYIAKFSHSYYLFPEYRDFPVVMDDHLPLRWVKSPSEINGIYDEVLKGEYYAFQTAVYSPEMNIQDITISFTDLRGQRSAISKSNITCINKTGVDLNGEGFEKVLNVNAGTIQNLWFGISIPDDIISGVYHGYVVIEPNGLDSDTVYLKMKVLDKKITNHGDNEPQHMSRLRWLNSNIGTDKEFIVKPFVPVVVNNKEIDILGREVVLNNMGLPKSISSFFKQEMTSFNEEKQEILSRQMEFLVIDSSGKQEQWRSEPFEVDQDFSSEVHWSGYNESDNFYLTVSGNLEYDGMLNYSIQLIAKHDIPIEDICLQVPYCKDVAQYMLGLGHKGGRFSDDINWTWDVEKNQEGVWLGTVNKGLQYVLRDENYERPLNTNFYHSKPLNMPYSWDNNGKGGIHIALANNEVCAKNYSGSRFIHEKDTLNFNIQFLITPFKLINTKTHFSTRFVHKYIPVDSVIALKGTIVNVHHANEINPYINYPFYETEKQKAYIEEAHSKGVKVKLYNTIRELSYKAYELFALKSLGDEIINDGEGGGHSWLQEHYKSNYHAAWHATSVNDAAILNKGNSRWTNYYIEGINWLAENQKIDGLYLDDVAFSRTTVKRIASVLSAHREEYVIDLHSANQFNARDGFINSAFLYMEHFPYISRLWFGEYFDYDMNPDYWLTEVSGIPFGLTGEMLEKGGHPFRGMVYGITNRVYGTDNPVHLWGLFDEFGIGESEMLGYWVDRSPVKTNSPGIRSTLYLKNNAALIAIGSWSNADLMVPLEIDWEKLGMDENNTILYSPKIEDLQEYQLFDLGKPVFVKRNKGLILILEEKK